MELGVFSYPALVTLTSELSPQRLRFDSRLVHVETVVGKEAMRMISLRVLLFPLFSSFHQCSALIYYYSVTEAT